MVPRLANRASVVVELPVIGMGVPIMGLPGGIMAEPGGKGIDGGIDALNGAANGFGPPLLPNGLAAAAGWAAALGNSFAFAAVFPAAALTLGVLPGSFAMIIP